MAEALSRLSAAVADRYRIERELGEGGMSGALDRLAWYGGSNRSAWRDLTG